MINRDGSGRAAAVTAQTLYTIMKEESNYLILFITLHVLERTQFIFTFAFQHKNRPCSAASSDAICSCFCKQFV